MVLFVTCSDPLFIIYLGKDKYENEDLIKYGFPIDIWFHADNYSSAHVYLRLPSNNEYTIDNIPQNVLEQCCQLVKDGSKDGRKKDKINVCYTPWENLKKTQAMEVGEVGFFDQSKVKLVRNVTKNSDLLKQLKKTLVEKDVDLAKEREAYDKEVSNKLKKELLDKKQKEMEEIAKAREIKKDKTFQYINDIGQETSNKEGKDLDEDFW